LSLTQILAKKTVFVQALFNCLDSPIIRHQAESGDSDIAEHLCFPQNLREHPIIAVIRKNILSTSSAKPSENCPAGKSGLKNQAQSQKEKYCIPELRIRLRLTV